MRCDLVKPPFVVFDFETTGFNPYQDEVIEYGGIKVAEDGHIQAVFHEFGRPFRKQVPERIYQLTGIRPEDILAAKDTRLVMAAFLSFIGDLPVVGHNVSFDVSFIKAKLNNGPFLNKQMDTLKLARNAFPQFQKHSLPYLTKVFNLPVRQEHSAEDDAFRTYCLYQIIAGQQDGGLFGKESDS